MEYQAVLSAVESLPIDDRIRLVQDVWDRLGTQADEPGLTEEMKAELDRRIEELDRNPHAGIPLGIKRLGCKGIESVEPVCQNATLVRDAVASVPVV